MLRFACLAFWLLAVGIQPTQAADAPAKSRRLMFFEYGRNGNRFVELGTDGKIVREFKPLSIAVIFQPLPDGHLLYAYGGKPTGVVEVDRDGKTVWNYVSSCPQVLGCERLANGNTLVAEQGPCQAVEVDRQGKVVHITPLTTSEKPFHLQVRNIHKLENGNILAAHEGEGAIREVAPDGRVVWEMTKVEKVPDARRLPNGNTLVVGGATKRLFEVTPSGKTVWEFGSADAPELNLTWLTSVQILKNGNYLVANFLRGQEGKGAHAFEVTRDKKVVWTFTDHARFKSVTTVRTVDE